MSNARRKPALTRVQEPHPAATAAAVATKPAVDAAEPATATRAGREGTTQLNVRVPASLKARAERGILALGVREGRRVTLAEVIEAALDSYLSQHDL